MSKIRHPFSHKQRINFLAYETMRGTFGNSTTRKYKLGKMYEPVQHRVNEIYKEAGIFPVLGKGRVR